MGLNYSLGGLTGNTLDSHRLAAHAYKEGGTALQNALMEVQFPTISSYFVVVVVVIDFVAGKSHLLLSHSE